MLVQLEPLADDAGKLALEKIYAVLLPHSETGMQTLIRQILYGVATRLEVILGAEPGRVKLHPAENMSFEWVGPVSDGLDQAYVCASYVFYSKSRMQRPRDNGIMTDKGIPHGLPI